MLYSYIKYIKEMSIPYVNNMEENIFKAIYNNDIDKLSELYGKLDFNNIKVNNFTPIEYACHTGRLEIVKELIKLGVDVNSSCPIHRAYSRKHTDIVEYLISIGADKNKLCGGMYPIMIANNVGLLEHALKNGFNGDFTYGDGYYFIYHLTNIEDIIIAIKYGVDITKEPQILKRNRFSYINFLDRRIIETILEYQPAAILFIKNTLNISFDRFIPDDLFIKYKHEIETLEDSEGLGLL